MKKIRSSNIISVIAIVLYCLSFLYSADSDSLLSVRNNTDKQYFVEFQNKTNVPIFDFKVKLSNFFSGNIVYKSLNSILDGSEALKKNLFNLTEPKISSFLYLINRNFIFKDYKICFPFHYFY